MGRIGAIQVLRNLVGGGWVGLSFPGKKRYEGVQFNVISVTKGWVGVKFPGKKHYITLEWPHTDSFKQRSSQKLSSNNDTVYLM